MRLSRLTVAFLVAVALTGFGVSAVLATNDNDQPSVIQVPAPPPSVATLVQGSDGVPMLGRKRVPAPVESVSVVRDPEGSGAFVAQVLAGLPDGCSQPDGFDVAREGNTYRVQVYNTVPIGATPCADRQGTYEITASLGTDFTAGHSYRIDANGKVSLLYMD